VPDNPQQGQQSKQQQAQQQDNPRTGPAQSQDPALPDTYGDLDPTKVVGTYAEQPDPNDERPAPLPNVPEGVKEAPADDADDAKAVGAQGGYGEQGDPVAKDK
jgi:hypothetical protein